MRIAPPSPEPSKRQRAAARAPKSALCSTHASGSVIAARSNVTPSAIGSALTAGTTSSSANPPGRPVMPCSV